MASDLWTAVSLLVGFIGGWCLARLEWWHDREQMSERWQEERDRSDNLLDLCERYEMALKSERRLLPDTFVWQPKDGHLTPFPTEFAKRVAELHSLNTGRTGGATTEKSSAVKGKRLSNE